MSLKATVIDAIEKDVATFMGREPIAGLGVGIVHGRDLIYHNGFGWADVDKKIPVTADTVFRIASISKVITAVGVMQQVDAGRIDLDMPVNDYLDGMQIKPRRPQDPPITVRHLLTHTSGLGELAPISSYLQPDTWLGMLGLKNIPKTLDDYYGDKLQPDSPPGEKWAYANHGYAVLGELIGDVDGRPFADVMRDRVFRPLGMDHSDFLRRENLQDKLAVGYKAGADPSPVMDVEIVTLADGSMFSTINDFARFTAALLNDGDGLLSAATMADMYRPHYQLHPLLPSMGLGFMLPARASWNGHLVAQHDGAWLGFTSSMWLAPEAGWGVFAFANSGGSVPINVAHAILRRLLPDDYRPFPPQLEPRPAPRPDLVGTYEPAAGWNSNGRLWYSYGARLTVEKSGADMVLRSRIGHWKDGVSLVPADAQNDLVMAAGRQPIVFGEDAAGGVDRLMLGRHVFYKQ